jgi:putative oxidoreductase
MPIPESWAPKLLSLMRIAVALAFMEHGTAKLFHFPVFGGPPDRLTIPLGILETFGGALVALGLFTRPAAFIAAGEMAFAYWIGHAPRGMFPANNGGDAAILFCFVFLYISMAGPGSWSLDALRRRETPEP